MNFDVINIFYCNILCLFLDYSRPFNSESSIVKMINNYSLEESIYIYTKTFSLSIILYEPFLF